MKLDENETFRKNKTFEDRLPVDERPRVQIAQKRREQPSHMRTRERVGK